MIDPRSPRSLGTSSLVAFPLRPMDPGGICTCPKGAECRNAGKHPARHMVQDPRAGYGIQCGRLEDGGSGLVVIDLDVKHNADGSIRSNGWETFDRLCGANGVSMASVLNSTVVVQTGSGVGGHVYFIAPDDFAVKSSAGTLGPGIDTRGAGGFVVGPGSPHKSGNIYRTVNDPGYVAPLPAFLYGDLRLRDTEIDVPLFPVEAVDPASPDGLTRCNEFASMCRGEVPGIGPSIEGDGGDAAMFHCACIGTLYFQLPPETAANIIDGNYNSPPRCVPSWEYTEIYRKCYEAIARNKRPSFGPMPDDLPRLLLAATAGGTSFANGAPLQIPDAAHKYQIFVGQSVASGKLNNEDLSIMAVRLSGHPAWRGSLYVNDITGRIHANNPPIQLDAEGKAGWSDLDGGRARIWLSTKADISATTSQVDEAVRLVAHTVRHNPIREWLASLPPAPDSALDNLATRYFGDDEPIAQECMRRFLIGSVRRLLFPGLKHDQVLVLGGKTGWKKTTFISTLWGEEYFLRSMGDISNKDSMLAIATAWPVELGELHRLLRADRELIKDFLSRDIDQFRAPYGRAIQDRPRICTFIGTTNETQYLNDPTSSRRYYPMRVEHSIDLNDVRRSRESVFAAAYRLALQPQEIVPHWIDMESPLGEALHARHRLHMTENDAWLGAICDYLAGRTLVTTGDVFRHAICADATDWLLRWTGTAQRALVDALRTCGCTQTTARLTRGYPERAWTVPEKFSAQPRKAAWGSFLDTSSMQPLAPLPH